jgi:hypothetical protein
MRPARALVPHWPLVLLALTFSLLVGAVPALPPAPRATGDGGHIGARQRHRVRGARHERGAGKPRDLEPGAAAGARVAVPVGRWGAVAALLAHVARSLPREALT